MIEIHIKTNGRKIMDIFNRDKTTLQETAVVLLSLKQIEQELIDSEFKSDLLVEQHEQEEIEEK